MGTNSFFDESREQSEVKTAIVVKYFSFWANVMKGAIRKRPNKGPGRIAYIDIFSGPGKFNDDSDSTPIQIVKTAILDQWLKEHLVTVFNDKEKKYVEKIRSSINGLPGVSDLKYKPKITNELIDGKIAELYEKSNFVPSLFFLDPWGYKGLSNKLINSVIKGWGCDVIFFFNYKRIIRGINNNVEQRNMVDIFGRENYIRLKQELSSGLSPKEKEIRILNALEEAIKSYGIRYVLHYRFRSLSGADTTHHLSFVSKEKMAYTQMKQIMARQSSSDSQGVPSLEYDKTKIGVQPLFELDDPLNRLKIDLMSSFTGKSLTVGEIISKHHIDTNYIPKNYKRVLKDLEKEGKIEVAPSVDDRPVNTMGDKVVITFPEE